MQVVDYTSRPVDIPASFLSSPPPGPITAADVPFAASGLFEYAKNHTAIILDDVLSADECRQLLSLAESSVPRSEADERPGSSFSPWKPALVSGPFGESLLPNYRNSDRIVWDEQTIVDRLWERCVQVPEVREAMGRVNQIGRWRGGEWVLTGANKRMRFLKYTKGQFFKPHADGPYGYLDKNGREFQTHFTLHLYLNDSAAALGRSGDDNDGEDMLVGGSTAFLSPDRERKVHVNPKTGSVLLFQHSNLVHEGSVVDKGVKYTMRTDILFKWVPEDEEPATAT